MMTICPQSQNQDPSKGTLNKQDSFYTNTTKQGEASTVIKSSNDVKSLLGDTESMPELLIEPGLVLLRNFVSDSECQELASMARSWGEHGGEDGFYTTSDSGQRILNTGDAGRGRIYDAATRFPSCVTDKCVEAVAAAQEADTAMPDMTCTHVLLNMYTSSEGLLWHRDIYENDGKGDHPVVNLCVGASCKFGIKHSDEDPERIIILRSGDVLLFGGPCRLIKHAVLEIMLDDCPGWMADEPCRFSFTFRDSPEVLGREAEFKYFKVSEHLVGQDEFELPDDPAKHQGIPSKVPSLVTQSTNGIIS